MFALEAAIICCPTVYANPEVAKFVKFKVLPTVKLVKLIAIVDVVA